MTSILIADLLKDYRSDEVDGTDKRDSRWFWKKSLSAEYWRRELASAEHPRCPGAVLKSATRIDQRLGIYKIPVMTRHEMINGLIRVGKLGSYDCLIMIHIKTESSWFEDGHVGMTTTMLTLTYVLHALFGLSFNKSFQSTYLLYARHCVSC